MRAVRPVRSDFMTGLKPNFAHDFRRRQCCRQQQEQYVESGFSRTDHEHPRMCQGAQHAYHYRGLCHRTQAVSGAGHGYSSLRSECRFWPQVTVCENYSF